MKHGSGSRWNGGVNVGIVKLNAGTADGSDCEAVTHRPKLTDLYEAVSSGAGVAVVSGYQASVPKRCAIGETLSVHTM